MNYFKRIGLDVVSIQGRRFKHTTYMCFFMAGEGRGGEGLGVPEGRTVTHHQEAGLQLLKHLLSSQRPTAELLEVNNCTACTVTHTELVHRTRSDRTRVHRTS